jgi:hypothetical protein
LACQVAQEGNQFSLPCQRIDPTDKHISDFRARSDKQYRVWDGSERQPKGSPDVARGLHGLISPQGTKRAFARRLLPSIDESKAHHRHLGCVGEITLMLGIDKPLVDQGVAHIRSCRRNEPDDNRSWENPCSSAGVFHLSLSVVCSLL